jgi:hypothetical protein
MDDTTPPPRSTHTPNGKFAPGNPGKPRGSRNRMTKGIAISLLAHYHANEAEFLDRLSQFFFSDYMRLLGRMLPRDDPTAGPELEGLAPADQARILAAVRGACDRIEAGEATLADVETALFSPSAEAPVHVKYVRNT